MVSASEQSKALYKKCVRAAIILKAYAAVVLILQISYKLINNKDFLQQYGLDSVVNSYLIKMGIFEYMPLFGFFNDTQGNIIWLFMSPILFFISSQILKDHFDERFKNKEAEEKAAESNKSRLLEEDDNSEKSGDFSSTNLKFRNNITEKLIGSSDKSRENDEIAK